MRTWMISSSWPASASTVPLEKGDQRAEEIALKTQIRTLGRPPSSDPTGSSRQSLILRNGDTVNRFRRTAW